MGRAEVQEAVCLGDRPHGALGRRVRGRRPGVQSGAQGGDRPLRGGVRVEATVQVYTVHSDRLLFSLRASTVRKLRSLYGEPGADTGAYIQLSESSSTTITSSTPAWTFSTSTDLLKSKDKALKLEL